MNTWFTEIVRDANERALNDQELERITVYYGGLPARLRAAEEVEQLESELAGTLFGELKKKHPYRTLYTRRLVQDLLESLRHMVQAMLADEPRMFRHRWVNHLTRVVAELDLDPGEIQDVYALVLDRSAGKLANHSRELLQPYFDELADALTPALAGR
ncbi:globin family protein [Frigoriglobus tundricola]|uniref:Uncharacterized protein n=1 Tax=Frigoriglobus tundricola TaxID=2774151 RepID=A0A6M5YWD2_9BACT|nr:hypothetical protein [Frigoriglobus tundricola]QJW97810.1 hypothetical protein FTUN_5390 [Frigoriglobus tundricola]